MAGAGPSTREMRETIRRLVSSFEETNSIVAELRALIEAHPPAPAPAPEPLLTVREVAKILGISADTARQLVLGGQLPALRVGQRWRVTPAEMRAFVEANAYDGTLPARRGG